MKTYNNVLTIFTIIPIFLLSTMVLFAGPSVPGLENDQCLICHQENEILPEDFQIYDIHLQAGLSCAGCHGGDPSSEDQDISMSKKNGFVGVPAKNKIPEFCGKCHSSIEIMRTFQPDFPTDQVAQFGTSVHGIKLKQGDKKVADCSSCHTSHAILGVTDPRSSVYPMNVPQTCRECHSNTLYMQEYGIPTSQYDDYAMSVHGQALFEKKDIGAPTCNDCHGNHGAMPPGIASISHVCGICHVNNAKYFSESPMAEPFEKSNLHSCEQCHGYHNVKSTSDEMVGVEGSSVCLNCHSKGDNGYITAEKIKGYLDEIVASQNAAVERWEKVKKIEMDDEEIAFLLQEINHDIIQSRTLLHLFDAGVVSDKINEAKEKIQKANVLSEKQITEHRIRRIGFGAATIIIIILVIAIYFKIREIEKRQAV